MVMERAVEGGGGGGGGSGGSCCVGLQWNPNGVDDSAVLECQKEKEEEGEE